jgi:hypothetical protein
MKSRFADFKINEYSILFYDIIKVASPDFTWHGTRPHISDVCATWYCTAEPRF